MLERTFHEPKFRVCCLGGFKLLEASSGTDMTPTNRKTRALIGYLCIVEKPVGREQLASLLWGERGDEQARASLRQAIYELRSLLGGDHLLKLDRDTVGVGDAVTTDVAEITAAAESGDLWELANAISSWHGEFLQYLPSIDPSFDAWLQSERLRVHESLMDSAREAVNAGMASGEIDPARKVVRLLQQYDGTNEGVLRLGLKLDHLAGDQAALHRRYERFRALLKSELDAAPAAETQRLFQELTAGSAASANGWRSPEPPGDEMKQDAHERREHGASAGVELLSVQPLDEAGTGLSARAPIRAQRRIGVVAAVIAVASLFALGWGIWSVLHKAPPTRQEPLVAVLPFQNLSADAGSQSFSNAIGEDVADALSRRIRVARTPPALGVQDAGAPRALTATHVLSGSIERMGDSLHVTTQLIELEDGRVVWSHAYNSAIAQTPQLRHAVAVQIAGALDRLLVSGSLAAPRMSGAAYEHYRKGRDLYLQRDPQAAAPELEASVRLAPDFADAWSSLAAARWLLARDTLVRKQPYGGAKTAAARAAAQRALALAPNNAEALGVLALLIPSTRLGEIDRQVERALRAEPNNTQVVDWHAEFLMYVGRNHEALDELTRVYVLGHAPPAVATDLALAALKTGRFDEAREMIDLLDRSPDNRRRRELLPFHVKYFLYRHDWFGLATWLGTLPDAVSAPVNALFRLYRETAIALATHQAEKFGPLRIRWRSEIFGDPDDAIQFLAALGDADGALGVLQSAVRSARNDALLTDPEWEALFVPDLLALRRDPRVPALLEQWGLSGYWQTANHLPDFMR